MEYLRGPLHKFAMSLFGAYKKQNPEGNLLFSPLTASTGFMLLLAGSSGATKQELENALHLSEDPAFQFSSYEDDIQMAFRRVLLTFSKSAAEVEKERQLAGDDLGLFQVFRINKLFIQDGVELTQEFTECLQKLKGEVEFVDFRSSANATRTHINAFVDEKLNGNLKECFQNGAVTKSTQLLLANGICFRARWQTVFAIERTAIHPFYQENGKSVEIPMMNGVFQLPYAEDSELDMTYIELPYLFNAASLLLLLPKKRNGLQKLQKALSPTVVGKLGLCKRMRKINLTLPKFRIHSNFDLKTAMQKLGAKTLFSEQADLGHMTPHRVSLSAASHSGFISVDEKGTDAVNSTAPTNDQLNTYHKSVSSLTGTSHGRSTEARQTDVIKAINVTVDHPFLFSVRHNKSGLMVCLGRFECVS